MKTLKELVIDTKCRKGKSAGIKAGGAFWVCRKCEIRRYGGDGIGQSSPSVKNYLILRHYRSGHVVAVVKVDAWHQNGSWSGGGAWAYDASGILECETIEDVIAKLKATEVDGAAALTDSDPEDLIEMLKSIGMVEALPSPDEEAV